jgi:hypothetical protein
MAPLAKLVLKDQKLTRDITNCLALVENANKQDAFGLQDAFSRLVHVHDYYFLDRRPFSYALY